MDLLKNFQALQSKMGDTQEKLKSLRAEGSSGGDLVKVVVDGSMESVSVTIDPIAVDPREIKMLEELIAASFTDATRKMRQMVQQEMTQIAASINLPPNLSGQDS